MFKFFHHFVITVGVFDKVILKSIIKKEIIILIIFKKNHYTNQIYFLNILWCYLLKNNYLKKTLYWFIFPVIIIAQKNQFFIYNSGININLKIEDFSINFWAYFKSNINYIANGFHFKKTLNLILIWNFFLLEITQRKRTIFIFKFNIFF